MRVQKIELVLYVAIFTGLFACYPRGTGAPDVASGPTRDPLMNESDDPFSTVLHRYEEKYVDGALVDVVGTRVVPRRMVAH